MSNTKVAPHDVQEIANGIYLVTSGNSGEPHTIQARVSAHGERLECDCPGFTFRGTCSHCLEVRRERRKSGKRVPDTLRVLLAQDAWNWWDGEPDYLAK